MADSKTVDSSARASARRTTTTTTARARRGSARTSPWLYVLVILIIVFCLFPFYWLVNISLKSGPDLSSADLFPPNPTLRNYRAVVVDSDFIRSFGNSAIIALLTTAAALLFGSLMAYALARLRFAGKSGVLVVILAVSTFPGIAIAAPLFKLWTDLGLYDSLLGLVLPYTALALPLATYTMTSFFREIPKELEEAALIDGASRLQAMTKVILPLASPGVATAGIFTFIFAWNEFLLAVTLTSSPAARTAPVAIALFTGSVQYEQPLGTISAAAVLITVPLIALVLIFQRRIVAGLTAGAVKG